MADFEDIIAPVTDNPSGTRQAFHFAPLNSFATIEKEGGLDAATLSEVSVVAADHVFNTGGRFYTAEMEVNKNSLTGEYQGAVRGNHDKFSFVGFIPNIAAKQMGLNRKIRAEKHMVLLPLNDGQVLQLGDEYNGAMVTTSFQTGTEEGGERGWNVSVTWFGYAKMYTGAISFTAAV